MEQKPIIIKKIIKHGHGHHGGSWKVAYADFVTAMMAFFLLMWLMGFTTEGERKAISDFFQNPSAIQGEGGASTSLIDMGKGMDAPRTNETKPNQDPNAINAKDVPTESPGAAMSASDEAKKLMTEADKKRLESLMEELKQAIDASQALKPFKDQLFIDITSEGLRIQIVDKENRPMFDVGSSNLQSYTKGIMREISKVVAAVPNRISIAGHTDARAYANIADYSNWELSTERANACRRELVKGGVGEAKFARVVGLASTALFDKKNPLSPINRRISIVVLNREAEEEMLRKEENDKQVEGTVGNETITPNAAPMVDAIKEPAIEAPVAVEKHEEPPVKPAKTATAPVSKTIVEKPVIEKPVVEKPKKPVIEAPPKASKPLAPKPQAAPSTSPAIHNAIQLPSLPINSPAIGNIAPPPADSSNTKK